MSTADLVAAVRRHALERYEDPRSSWDYVVECWSDADIIESIGQARTAKGAVRKVAADLAPMHDHRSEIEATAW